MPDWRAEYLSSLDAAASETEPTNKELVEACSQLSSRVAALEAEKSLWSNTAPAADGGSGAGSSHNAASTAKVPKPTPKSAQTTASASASTSASAPESQLRLDLAESLRARGVMETRLRAAEDELSRLRTRTRDDARALTSLKADCAALSARLRDRDLELREKRKMIEQVQDEHIALELQVSVAERERDNVKRENKELVDRWMARMGLEADAMNLANDAHHLEMRGTRGDYG